MGVRVIKEISQGQSGSLSDQAGGVQYTRVFKIVLDTPADIQTVDIIGAISSIDGGFDGIGTLHPTDPFASCDSVSATPEGDSRLVYTATVSYTPSDAISLTQGGNNDNTPDEREKSPDLRAANWSTSTTTIEVPSWIWIPQWGPMAGVPTPTVNPAGDIVDGVTILQPIVNISVEQYCSGDQTVFSQAVGKVNSNQGQLGSLNLFPRSVLFRSVSFKPHAEMVGKKKWRGWLGSFEFSYKPNYNNYLSQYLGWDIAIPLSGFNVINSFAGQDVDKGACQLVLENDTTGAIKDWPNNPQLVPGLQNKKVRANVLISIPTDVETRAAQRPSASPVPLNENGTPRDPDAPMNRGGPVLVRRYQIYDSFDMSTLGLRFRT